MSYKITIEPKPKNDDLASSFSHQAAEEQPQGPITVDELADCLAAAYPEAVIDIPDDARDCVITSGPSPVRRPAGNPDNMQCWPVRMSRP